MTDHGRPQATPTATNGQPTRVPLLSLILGYGAVLPLPIAAIAVSFQSERLDAIVDLSMSWGAAILIFLAGVRRGLSFRTAGGPAASQVIISMLLFLVGIAALLSPFPWLALSLLLAGYAALLVIDPVAASWGTVPAFFEALRPGQMLVAVASLSILLMFVVL